MCACRFCKSGKYWMCGGAQHLRLPAREVAEGGMAQYMRIPKTAIVHKISEGSPWKIRR